MKKVQLRLWFVFGIILLLSSFTTVFGQEYRGTITGAVTDPQGSIVPAATVTLQNVETNISSMVSSNEDGNFSFPLLLPGKYKLTATAANFKTSVRENIQLNVSDRLTID